MHLLNNYSRPCCIYMRILFPQRLNSSFAFFASRRYVPLRCARVEKVPARTRGPESVSCNFHRVGGYPLFRITGSLREVRSCRSSGTIEARFNDARIRAILDTNLRESRHRTIDRIYFRIFFFSTISLLNSSKNFDVRWFVIYKLRQLHF